MKNLSKTLLWTLVIALVLPVASYAGNIYKWVDDEGVTNFTDDKNKVPEEYLNQLEEFEMKPVTKSKAVKKAPATVKEEKPGEKLYGKYTVREWSDLFRVKYGEIHNKEKKLQIMKDYVEVYQRSLRLSEHYLAEKQRIARLKAAPDYKPGSNGDLEFNVTVLDRGQIFSKSELEKYQNHLKEIPKIEKEIKSAEAELTEMKRKATYYGVPKKVRAGEQ